MSQQRVITYIDGYNLYHGLLEAGLRSSRWLDLPKLGRSLLKSGQQLTLTRYFTTRVKGDPAKARRQALYVDALTTRGGIEIDFGHFLSKRVTCHSCGHTWTKSEEKKTDVNIAVRMLEDAYDDRFDTAIVISGDSDLATPVETIRRRFPHKRVLVAFPPKRYSHELCRVADATFRIFNRNIRTSHLPATVTTRNGTTLTAPQGWLPAPHNLHVTKVIRVCLPRSGGYRRESHGVPNPGVRRPLSSSDHEPRHVCGFATRDVSLGHAQC